MAMSDKRAFVDAVRNKYAPSLPPIDRERYTDVKGLEGPFRLRSGKVVYYDPKEGKYYDRDKDMYMSHDEYDSHANTRESVDFFRFAEILNESGKLLPIKRKSGETVGYRKEREKAIGLVKAKDDVYKKAVVPKCSKCGKPMAKKGSTESGDSYECECGARVRGWKTESGWKASKGLD